MPAKTIKKVRHRRLTKTYFDKTHCGVIKTQFQERIASACGNILTFDKISGRAFLRYIVLIGRLYFRKIVPRASNLFENTNFIN